MRRPLLAATLVSSLVVASCTGGRNGAVTATEARATDRPTATSDGATDDSVDIDGTESGPRLPGLLDTSDVPIDPDPDVKTGTLDNGLRYYVRENDNPGSRAELRLVIDAGSVNETASQSGAAHFLEHMLFNGTTEFPANELVAVLRGFGAEFGADINASTSYDETIYQLTVPTDDGEAVETGMRVLQQWLAHATLDQSEVEAERGVVLDEWRNTTQSSEGRQFEAFERLYFDGTVYAGRSPIGSAEAIESMQADDLRAYYDAWYRPDNAGVVVVGDIDGDEIIDQIERLFGDATGRGADPDRVDASFTIDTQPDAVVQPDPDEPSVTVEVALPIPAQRAGGTAAARADVLDTLLYDALVRRLEDDIVSGVAPFDGISLASGSFVRGIDAPSLLAITDADRATESVQAILDEYERVVRFGFADAEVGVSEAWFQSVLDTQYEGRDSAQDRFYAERYVDNFLTDEPIPSIADEYDLVTAMGEAATPEALRRRFEARWANSAPHVLVSGPEGANLLTRDDVLDLVASLPERELVARGPQSELPAALMDAPEPVQEISAQLLAEAPWAFLEPTELVFENGVRVIFDETPIVEGAVSFQARSPGGSSLLDDGDVIDSLFAPDVVMSSGVSGFNQTEVDRILAGADVQIAAAIQPYTDELYAEAASADLEELFQLIHLYMAQPRFDAVALDAVRRTEQALVDDPGSDQEAASYDAVLDARYPGELRYSFLPEPDDFATLDLNGVERVWRDRFGDAGDWVFVFVGDFDPDDVTALARAYLGTLPSTGTKEEWIDVEDPPPAGVVHIDVAAGTGDRGSVTMLYTAPIDDVDPVDDVAADVVTKIVSTRLDVVIREELGESYSPFFVSYLTADPDPVFETYVQVTGAPDRLEAISALVVTELDDLRVNGPTSDEFSNAKEQTRRDYELFYNGQLVEELLEASIRPDMTLDDFIDRDLTLDKVDAAAVRDFLVRSTPVDQYIEVFVAPR